MGINYETYIDNFLWVNNPIVVFPFVQSKSTCRKFALNVNTLNKVSTGNKSIEDLGSIFVRSSYDTTNLAQTLSCFDYLSFLGCPV